jgi:hypothetical protein
MQISGCHGNKSNNGKNLKKSSLEPKGLGHRYFAQGIVSLNHSKIVQLHPWSQK